MATTTKPSIRVQGVTYTDPDEARVAADELEHQADELAARHRAAGRDGEADTVQDRGHENAARLRAWAREREAAEAEATEQPPDTPQTPPRSRRGASRRRHSLGRRLATPTPRVRSLASDAGIPQATSTATSLVMQIVGLTLAIAFLTLILTRRGTQAFSDIAGGGAHFIAWFFNPTDPLAPHTLAAGQNAAHYARSGAATRPPVGPRGGSR